MPFLYPFALEKIEYVVVWDCIYVAFRAFGEVSSPIPHTEPAKGCVTLNSRNRGKWQPSDVGGRAGSLVERRRKKASTRVTGRKTRLQRDLALRGQGDDGRNWV